MKETTLNILAIKVALVVGTLISFLSADIVTKIKSDDKNAEIFLGKQVEVVKNLCVKKTKTKIGDDIIIENHKGKRVLINNSKSLAIWCPKD